MHTFTRGANKSIGGVAYTGFLIITCAFLLLISACQTTEGDEEPEAVSDAGAESAVPGPTATAEPDTDPEPDDADMADEEEDHCLDCHTDKDRLIDTAAPEEEVVHESSGEG